MFPLKARKLVIVHQHDGPSIQGIQVGFAFFAHEYRLRDASLIEAEGQSTPLEGEQRIPRERVYFRQLVARSA
jgi:hypothetical protein